MTDKIKKAKKVSNGGGDAVYAFGIIGSLVYYIQQADGFWPVIAAFFKALVWPALLVYDVLKYVHGG